MRGRFSSLHAPTHSDFLILCILIGALSPESRPPRRNRQLPALALAQAAPQQCWASGGRAASWALTAKAHNTTRHPNPGRRKRGE
eukprot:scaffold132349_cov33-Tisochrysis_lutea.AAC.2